MQFLSLNAETALMLCYVARLIHAARGLLAGMTGNEVGVEVFMDALTHLYKVFGPKGCVSCRSEAVLHIL